MSLHTLWTLLLLLIDVTSPMPMNIRTCTDLKPLYLINHVIPNRYTLPRGVSIVYDEEHSLHAYKLGQHAGNLNFAASDIFTQCSYWPEEYSILATFRLSPHSDTPTWENGYLFSLIPESSVHLKLGVSVSRDQVTLFYSDYQIPPGKKSITFNRQLYDDKWHTIIITVAGDTVGLRVDCEKTEVKDFERTSPAFLDTSGDHIHVGNRKIQPGQFRGLLKQLLILPGGNAGQLACPNKMPSLPSISRQPDVQMMEADGPHKVTYQIPYDAECNWQETGKMWYDIYGKLLKVCHSGTWRLAQLPSDQGVRSSVQTIPRLDYFDVHQQVVGPAPSIDIHTFTVPGEGKFVMMANYNHAPSASRKQKSLIYKWTNESLVPYQNITAYAPSSITTFHIGNQFYAAVANMKRRSHKSKSEVVAIFKWHARKKKFKPYQTMPASEPRDVEHFEIDGSHYLAVANHRAPKKSEIAPNNYDANSFIWKFNEKKKRFFEFQKIATIGAWDWTYFSSSSQSGEVYHFLVVANTLNNKREVKLDSKLYIWNKERQTGLGNFVFYQSFATSAATDFEYFEMNGDSYLAVANSVSSLEASSTETKYSSVSRIYKGNRERRRFEVFQEIQTFGIIDWEYFTIGNDSYLLASNQQPKPTTEESDRLANKATVIYRWQGSEKFVPKHKFDTGPAADWEVIQDEGNTYILYANGASNVNQIYKAKYEIR